jgi:hypothetical protein
LRWTGLPAAGEIPSFSDARVRELLSAARAAGLAPRSDADLLPLLLELIGGNIPVSDWPTQMPRKARQDYARQAEQGRAAAADRPPGAEHTARDVPRREPEAVGWRAHAEQTASLVESELRRRRRDAVAGKAIALPPRLGQGGARGLLQPPSQPPPQPPSQPSGDCEADDIDEPG